MVFKTPAMRVRVQKRDDLIAILKAQAACWVQARGTEAADLLQYLALQRLQPRGGALHTT